MRVSLCCVLMLSIMTLLSSGVSAEEEEVTIPLDQLPKAVVESVKKMFPGAELKKATREVAADEDDDNDDEEEDSDKKDGDKQDHDEKDDDDKESEVVYEVTLSEKGRQIEVTVEEDGEIEEVERSIDLKELPKFVTDAISNQFPDSSLKSAEAIYEVEDGEQEFEGYEVILVNADNKEIEVDVEVEIEISSD